jgi:HPt (histidine-containing phosphotransfer) domain-containing protein
MTVQECYQLMEGDYEGVLGRLLKTERIQKYLQKFKDSDDYSNMLTALRGADYETAFRMSHNLKGNSMNLGFTGLQASSSELCEALRGGAPTIDIGGMVSAVGIEYDKVIAAIQQLS